MRLGEGLEDGEGGGLLLAVVETEALWLFGGEGVGCGDSVGVASGE